MLEITNGIYTITNLQVELRFAQYHPRFVSAILGFLRIVIIPALRCAIRGWCESAVSASQNLRTAWKFERFKHFFFIYFFNTEFCRKWLYNKKNNFFEVDQSESYKNETSIRRGNSRIKEKENILQACKTVRQYHPMQEGGMVDDGAREWHSRSIE